MRFWSFNTCRIKFVSVQPAVGKGPSMSRGSFSLQSGSSLVVPIAAAPSDARLWGWAHVSWLVASRGQVCLIAGLEGSRVLSWGVSVLGQGQGTSTGSLQGTCSEPGSFHAVQPQQAQALPAVGDLLWGCLQGDLQARDTTESFGSATPTPAQSAQAQMGPSQPRTGRC